MSSMGSQLVTLLLLGLGLTRELLLRTLGQWLPPPANSPLTPSQLGELSRLSGSQSFSSPWTRGDPHFVSLLGALPIRTAKELGVVWGSRRL